MNCTFKNGMWHVNYILGVEEEEKEEGKNTTTKQMKLLMLSQILLRSNYFLYEGKGQVSDKANI